VTQLWQTHGPWIVTVTALVVGFLVVGLGYRVLRRVSRKMPVAVELVGRTHKPAQLLVALLVARAAVVAGTGEGAWREPLLHLLLVTAIAAGGWAIASLLPLAEQGVTRQLRLEDPVRADARRAQTQLTVLRRVALALVAVLTIGSILYTFPAVRGVGTSLLASAGLLGVIGGLAAQSTLNNFFAGL
jgi:small-conductance mechanosensitive channel